VNTAIQEDKCDCFDILSRDTYEYFKYMYDLLEERGAGHIKIFGGGGGVILPSEIEELQAYGLLVFMHLMMDFMGLQGMINDLVERFPGR
jgi:methylmalonyl-CoA mutase